MSLHGRIIGISALTPGNVSDAPALPLKRRKLKIKIKDKPDAPPTPTAAQQATGAPNVDTAREVPNVTWSLRLRGR